MMGVGPTHTAPGFIALRGRRCGRATRQTRRDGQLKIRVRHQAQSRSRESRRGEERRGEERGEERGRKREAGGEEATDGLLINSPDASAPRDELVDCRSTSSLQNGRDAVVCRRPPPSVDHPPIGPGGVVFESVLSSVGLDLLDRLRLVRWRGGTAVQSEGGYGDSWFWLGFVAVGLPS